VASTDGNSAVQADAVMPLVKACLGSEMNGAQSLHWCARKTGLHTRGKAEINQTMQRFDVFFYRSLKMYSTNIFIHFVTENLMFAVLRLNHGGVSSSTLVL